MAVRMRHHLGSVMGELRFEPVPYRVRAWAGGEVVIDSTGVVLVWEPRRLIPVYAVPLTDIAGEVTASEEQPPEPDLAALPPMLGPQDFFLHTTPGEVVDLATGSSRLDAAGYMAADPELEGLVLVDFGAFTSWRVEDQVLVGHAHDPFKRIDVTRSNRRVEVSLPGAVLAASSRASLLWETHLPPRWYLPADDVRMELLEPSATVTTCAYKGHASYLSLVGGPSDIAWFYPDPLHDAVPVKDLICFWSERTDLVLDGEPVERPITPWSRPDEIASASAERLEFG
jgi:uncharacterized protein (DUF427 family)